jgi:hypothetical protein
MPDSTPSTIDSNIMNINNELHSLNDIVNKESVRLSTKKYQVDQSYPTTIRSIYMNQNFQQRYSAYLGIVIVIIIALVIVFFISTLSSFFPIIPSYVVYIVYIVCFAGAIIYTIVTYMDIQKHDSMDYNKYKHKKPDDSKTNDIIITSDDTSSNSYNFGQCGTGTYLSDSGICTVGSKSGFTTMNNEVKQYNTYEYTDYSRYK